MCSLCVQETGPHYTTSCCGSYEVLNMHLLNDAINPNIYRVLQSVFEANNFPPELFSLVCGGADVG